MKKITTKIIFVGMSFPLAIVALTSLLWLAGFFPSDNAKVLAPIIVVSGTMTSLSILICVLVQKLENYIDGLIERLKSR